jgi:hypothetical protein
MSRYAPDEVNTDEKKHDAFLNGLNNEIQFQLLNTDYEDIQKMVDKAIIVKNMIKEMEKNGKRKAAFSWQSLGSNTRPRSSVKAFLQKPEYGLPVYAWTTCSIPYATTELSGTAPKLLDAEASAPGSSSQCVATILLEHAARSLPNRSNLPECTSLGKL